MSEQLAALGDVAAAFERGAIEHWLFGGWAVDFHAGVATRAHDDVDFAVRLADMPVITRLLEADGWLDLQDPEVHGGIAFGRDGVRLELTYLECYPMDGEGAEVRELNGVRSRVVALGVLTRMKDGARDDPIDVAKDRADHRLLRDL